MESIPRNTAIATLEWLEAFVATLAANPANYMLQPAQVTALTNLVVLYRQRFDVAGVVNRLAVNPAGYTQPNRAAMYDARAAALEVAGAYATQIQNNPGISDANKLAAGVLPKNFTRTARPVPTSTPLLTIAGYQPRAHDLSWAQSDQPTITRLPIGANAVMLRALVATTPPAQPESMPTVGIMPRALYRTPQWPESLRGQTAYYAAQWMGARGELGPLSPMINAVIP